MTPKQNFEIRTQKQVHEQNFSPIEESDPSSITPPNESIIITKHVNNKLIKLNKIKLRNRIN